MTSSQKNGLDIHKQLGNSNNNSDKHQAINI